jgi:integrase
MPEPRRRTLISDADFNRLVDACMVTSMKKGHQLADFLRFLAFTGAREQEALAVGWTSIDFDGQTVSIGAGDTSKNRETRLVDFNPALAALLSDMKGWRACPAQ